MPEIDSDLFQVLALLLLFLTLITLLAALSALSKIRKSLEARPQSYGAPAAQAYEAPAAAAYEPAYAAPAQAAQPEVATGFVPVAEAVPVAAAPAATSTALRGDEPEEQPFERDGRWWFKRGGELLVYDEGTGQWVAAPQGGAVAAPVTQTATIPAAGAVASTDVGEGWKCSSCGAVNGSTATSCRMCFAPR
jgi:ribosomal protein L40E